MGSEPSKCYFSDSLFWSFFNPTFTQILCNMPHKSYLLEFRELKFYRTKGMENCTICWITMHRAWLLYRNYIVRTLKINIIKWKIFWPLFWNLNVYIAKAIISHKEIFWIIVMQVHTTELQSTQGDSLPWYSLMPRWGMSPQYIGNVTSYTQKGKMRSGRWSKNQNHNQNQVYHKKTVCTFIMHCHPADCFRTSA